jgi:O-succinylbenzoic acid--CoA ligase
VIALEVAAGCDPSGHLIEAWSRGKRVLLLGKSAPEAARSQLLAASGAREVIDGTKPAPARANSTIRGLLDARDFPPSAGVVLATSGSSGVPRLIDIGLDALVASARLGATVIPFGEGDAWHASLAPTHIGGLMIFVRAMALGGAVRAGAQPRAWSDLEGATHVSLVAAQLARLLEDAAPPPRSLQAVMLGGGPSAQPLRDAAIARGIPLFATYGLTETSSQVATGALALGDAATLAGAALPGVSIAIDAVTSEILIDGPTLARGEILGGEIYGGEVAPLSRPLRTRDAGFLDDRGRLHVVGRLDSMFISGGKNIHPETIERALASIPEVRSSCVIGVPHEKWGARPVAFVDLAAQPARALRDQLRAMLEPHLVPDAILAMPADEAAAMKPSRARLSVRMAAGERFAEIS